MSKVGLFDKCLMGAFDKNNQLCNWAIANDGFERMELSRKWFAEHELQAKIIHVFKKVGG